MPRKSRVEDDHASIQVEMMIPARQSGRAKTIENVRGPAVPMPPRIPRVARLMALAIKCQDMVDRGEVRDYADLARLGHVTRARMSQIMNLLLLAPDIQESLLYTTQEVSITERHMRSAVREVSWRAQRVVWEFSRRSGERRPENTQSPTSENGDAAANELGTNEHGRLIGRCEASTRHGEPA